MNENVRDFLRKFRLGELTERGILRRETPWLRGSSVPPLMALMKEHGVPPLVAQERNWYLTSDGEFSNPGSKDILQGHYENPERHGNVFRKQNRHINPHWTGSLAYPSSNKETMKMAMTMKACSLPRSPILPARPSVWKGIYSALCVPTSSNWSRGSLSPTAAAKRP